MNEPVIGTARKQIIHQTANHYEHCKHEAHNRYELAELGKLFVERCLDVAALIDLGNALALLGIHTYSCNAIYGRTLNHGGTAQKEIGSIGGVGVKVLFYRCLGCIRLPCKIGLINAQGIRLYEFSVSGYLIAALEFHHIADHHIMFFNKQHL